MSDSFHLQGLAAVFNEWTAIGEFDEMIKPGAFTRTLRENGDVVFLHNHETANVLGRTPLTLRLRETRRGLEFDLELDKRSPLAQQVQSAVDRGDLKQMSFGFSPQDDQWDYGKDGRIKRQLLDVDLLEVSSATFPAYKSTAIVISRSAGVSLDTAIKLRAIQARADAIKKIEDDDDIALCRAAARDIYRKHGLKIPLALRGA